MKKTKKKSSFEEYKKYSELKKACVAFEFSKGSVQHFEKLYDTSRAGKSGTSSHQEQDILRAMFLFACAGLDTVVKQLINDSLPKVISKDGGAEREFEKFIERRIRKGDSNILNQEQNNPDEIKINFKLIARAIASTNPRKILLKELMKDLTGNSLQSIDQLLRVAGHFAISKEEIVSDYNQVKEVLYIRNIITHEMDIDFSSSSYKNRRQRSKADMKKYSSDILSVVEKFIDSVYKKIK